MTLDDFQIDEPDFLYVVDIDTPYTKSSMEKLEKFVNWFGPRMKINALYHKTKQDIDEGHPVWRPGYAFMFWFDNITFARIFARSYGAVVEHLSAKTFKLYQDNEYQRGFEDGREKPSGAMDW